MWMLYALQLSISQAKKNEHFMLCALSGIRYSRKTVNGTRDREHVTHPSHLAFANSKE